jgi:peptide/nickel transport system substrate-binding protein
MTFSKPYAEWERMTLQSWGEPMMISPAQVKKTGNEKFADAPVGTGPFKFVENVPGDRIVLERFKEYWGPQANVDKLVFRRLDDPAARVAALRTGEVDFILAPPPDEVDALKKDKFQVLQSNAPHIWYWHLNMKDEHFKDVRVRRALQMSVDKDKMCKELLRGTAKPAWSMISPATAAYDPKYKPYSYDPEKAKALLKEAGHGNGFETTFWTSTSGFGPDDPGGHGRVDPARSRQGRDQGEARDVRLDHVSRKMFQGLRPGHGALPALLGYDEQLLDRHRGALDPASRTRASTWAGTRTRRWTALLDTARAELEEKKRALVYKQIDRIVMEEDAAFFPICNDLNLVVLSPKVKGFVNPPEEWFQLWTPWVEA